MEVRSKLYCTQARTAIYTLSGRMSYKHSRMHSLPHFAKLSDYRSYRFFYTTVVAIAVH